VSQINLKSSINHEEHEEHEDHEEKQKSRKAEKQKSRKHSSLGSHPSGELLIQVKVLFLFVFFVFFVVQPSS
jgi:hypothetical protein